MSDRLTRDHVIWAYRLLLDREPENEAVLLPKMRAWTTTKQLRTDIMTSEEFRQKNPDYAHTNDPVTVIKPFANGVRLVVSLADHVIGLAILRDRFEIEELAFIQSAVTAGQHVLDIGAHIGFFTVHLAAAVGDSGSVTAFEPFEANADLLEQSLRENRFESRVRLIRAAVADRSGAADLAFARETLNTGGAFLSGLATPADLVTARVDVAALDDMSDLKRPIAFIKIDVEGAEPLFVRGAARLLAEDRPVILSELHLEQLARVAGASAASYIRQLADLGYECRQLAGDRPGAIVDPERVRPISSVVFVPIRT